ncbi:aminotransferase-like domain-containing protein [Nocardia altamirensis]|uniref:aminotransferase-like domain-containing protein n=1 Tax=Nocardia altamirensis TaxID=472158 RepID=UPI001C3F62F8|nr:PLP-dependent aminotransferase family protein [Nocardia altamirensis]
MNFLNEVANHFPDAISFAAGRPFEGFFDIQSVHGYLATYREHLLTNPDYDEATVLRTLMQYGRTKGIIHDLIAAHLDIDENITVDPESIVVTVGCQEAMFLTLRALRRTADDVVLAVLPGYVGLAGAAQLADMTVLGVKDSTAGIDLDDLLLVLDRAEAAGQKPRACYVTPDFANPSGISFSLETRNQLLRIADEHDFLILEDNPYGMFYGDNGYLPTLKALDRTQRVVYLGSFAKTGFPGARVGYVVADQRVHTVGEATELLADQLAKIKSMLTVNTSPIAQAIIGGKLLQNGGSLRLASIRERQIYQNNLHQILAGLATRFPPGTVPSVSWNTPTGGFFLVLTVPFVVDDDLLTISALEHGVLWTPLHYFYGDGQARNHLRLSFSHLTPDEIETGLDRLAAFVRKYSV